MKNAWPFLAVFAGLITIAVGAVVCVVDPFRFGCRRPVDSVTFVWIDELVGYDGDDLGLMIPLIWHREPDNPYYRFHTKPVSDPVVVDAFEEWLDCNVQTVEEPVQHFVYPYGCVVYYGDGESTAISIGQYTLLHTDLSNQQAVELPSEIETIFKQELPASFFSSELRYRPPPSEGRDSTR